MQSSPEITHQDDVTAFGSSRQRQLTAVMRPVKVKNLSRLKSRNLFRGSAAQFLSPDVGDTVPGQYIINCLTSWRPARLLPPNAGQSNWYKAAPPSEGIIFS